MNPSAAQASSVHATEALLYFTLLQLAVIVLAARVGNEIAKRFGQAGVVGEIIVGILLGPSLFGLLAPDLFGYVFRSVPPGPMTMLSQIGLIFLMFQIGLEFDFSHLTARDNRRSVLYVAAAGLLLPFALGLGFGFYTAPQLSPKSDAMASALFVATAFSITALPILGRIMIEFAMTRTRLGVIAISAAAINDVIGWLMLAVVSSLAVSHFSPADFVLNLGALALYVVVCWWVVRPLLRWAIARSGITQERFSANLFGLLIVVIFVSAIATYKLGIFAIFGGFMMGVLLHDQPQVVQAWRAKAGEFITVFFLPIFFTFTGLRTNIGALNTPELWGWCLLLVFLACLGKFGGCYAAARAAGLDHAQGRVLGIMMNTRALMELIIINVGLDLGVISQNVFTMLVLMAIFSTVITVPLLRRWLPQAGIPVPDSARPQAPRAGASLP
jgi:Kef-type K+ transport system membrane component KefB